MRDHRLPSLVALSAWLVTLAACGPDVREACLESCAASNDCSDDDLEKDCDDACDEAVEAAEVTECESETVSFYDCFLENEVCTAEDVEKCEIEYFEVRNCILDFCDENPESEQCDVSGG